VQPLAIHRCVSLHSPRRTPWRAALKSVAKLASLACAFSLISFVSPIGGQGSVEVTVVDQRSAASFESRRAGPFSAIAFLPEKAVKPAPVEQLQDALSRRATQPISLVISEMRVIDFFPARLNAGLPGGLIGEAISERLVESSTDWSMVDAMGITGDTDSVICLLAGTLNGIEVSFAAHTPYKLGRGAMVRSNENFKAAVTNSIDQVAQQVVARISVLPTAQ
jgi:hypothetical protein